MENCIFCKVATGKIPHNRFYKNEDFIAFLDINPVMKGHTLLIPKKHIVWMQDADNKTISEIFKLSKKLMRAIKKGLKCDYVQLSIAGAEVPHFHIHLIPRYLNDGLPKFATKKYNNKEEKEIIKKIISAIP